MPNLDYDKMLDQFTEKENDAALLPVYLCRLAQLRKDKPEIVSCIDSVVSALIPKQCFTCHHVRESELCKGGGMLCSVNGDGRDELRLTTQYETCGEWSLNKVYADFAELEVSHNDGLDS